MTGASGTHRLLRSLLFAAMALGLILAAGLVLLPYAIQRGLPYLAARHGLTLTIEGVHQDLVKGELTLTGVVLAHGGEVDLRAQEVDARLSVRALLAGDLSVERLALDKGELVLRRDAGGRWSLAGFGPAADPWPVLWQTASRELALNDVGLRFAGGKLPGLHVAHLSTGRLAGRVAPDSVAYRLSATLAAGDVRAGGRIRLQQNPPEIDAELRLSGLDLASLIRKRPGARISLSAGALDADVNVRLSWQQDEVSAQIDGDARLRRATGELDGLLFKDATALWRGKARLEHPADGASMGIDGHLGLERGTVSWPGSAAWLVDPGAVEVLQATWDGRVRWQSAQGVPADLGLDGDAEIQRLDLSPPGGAHDTLEKVSLWGIQRAPGTDLVVGGLRARRASGILPPAAAPAPQAASALTAVRWSIEDLEAADLGLDAGQALRVGSLSTGAIRRSGPLLLGGLGALHLNGLRYGDARWSARDSVLEDLRVQRTGADGTSTLSVGQAALLDPSLANGLVASQVRLTGLVLDLLRSADGAWLWPLEIPADSRVNDLVVSGRSSVALEDHSVSPPARIQLHDVQGRLLAWGAPSPSAGHFDLKARSALDGEVALTGHLATENSPDGLAVAGHIEALDLASLSGYTHKLLGARAAGGRMDAALDLTRKQGQWRGPCTLSLTAPRLLPTPTGTETVSLPAPVLARAQRLLRDAEDRIQLAVGLGEPGTEPGGALGLAIREAVARFYQPLGLDDKGLHALLHRGRASLSPVVFAPGSQHLDETARAYLKNLADHLAERPALRLGVCADPTSAAGGAATVAAYLTQELRLSPGRIRGCSSGSAVPGRVALVLMAGG